MIVLETKLIFASNSFIDMNAIIIMCDNQLFEFIYFLGQN